MLGVGFGLAVTIGNAIGAGILRAPGEVAGHLPDPWLFLAAWVVGGLYALLGAIQIAELGTMMPRSGGQYVFSRYALGDYAGFIVGWSDWISTCGTTAAVAIVVGEFAGALFRRLTGRGAARSRSAVVCRLRGRCSGAASAGAALIQNVTSSLKALAFVALIVAAFASGAEASIAGRGDDAAGGPRSGRGVRAVAAGGDLHLRRLVGDRSTSREEVENPGRAIPRSLIGGVLAIIAIYLLVNLSLLHVLPVSRIAGEEFAAGTVAGVIFGRTGRSAAAAPHASCRC